MDEQQATFTVEKIYIKDSSFESPNTPAVFMAAETPNIDVNLSTQSQVLAGAPDLIESVLTVTVTAKTPEKTMFMIELQQAGLFRVQNVPSDHMPSILGVHCPTILFPYAREAIADLIGKGGFQPLHLNPINFEALYQSSLQQKPEGTIQ